MRRVTPRRFDEGVVVFGVCAELLSLSGRGGDLRRCASVICVCGDAPFVFWAKLETWWFESCCFLSGPRTYRVRLRFHKNGAARPREGFHELARFSDLSVWEGSATVGDCYVLQRPSPGVSGWLLRATAVCTAHTLVWYTCEHTWLQRQRLRRVCSVCFSFLARECFSQLAAHT